MTMKKIHPLVEKVLFDRKTILDGIKRLAQKLNKKYQKKNAPVIFLGILKGCLPFMMELIKHLNFDLKLDFMVISSYFGGVAKRYQKPKLILDADFDLNDHHIVLIEDIIETGNTINTVKKHLKLKNPRSLEVVSLIFKKEMNLTNLEVAPDFYVFDAPMEFLVGFGLDYQEELRNLDYIGVLKT